MISLLPQQTKALDKLISKKVGALFMQPGTAKSRIALELGKSISNIDLVEWIGPLNSIRIKEGLPNIVDEVNKWGGFGVDTYFTGVESLQNSDRIFLEIYNRIKNAENSLLIHDESSKIKNPDAKRTKRLLQLSENAEYKIILNGTPFTKNLLDIYSQIQFLSPNILRMSFAEFKNTFCEYTRVTKRFGGYKEYTKEYITGYENIDYLYRLIGPYIFECDLDLSVKQIYDVQYYSLGEAEQEEYDYLKNKYLDDETLLWKNNNIFLEMTQKMQHSYCCTEEKFEVVENYFEKNDPTRSIIFCKYIRSREECEKRFPKATVLSYQKEAESLNLQHLNRIIYFDQNWDLLKREQSKFRTFRTGQEYDCFYLDLIGNIGLDQLISQNIKKKTSMVEYFKKISKKELQDVL